MPPAAASIDLRKPPSPQRNNKYQTLNSLIPTSIPPHYQEDLQIRTMSNKTLLLVGSGPGNGAAVASLFAQRYFDNIALFARNPVQLDKDRETVLASAASVNRIVTVQTWQVDIGDSRRLEEALAEVAQFGALECVYFNAARVAPSPFFDFPISGIEEDFKVLQLSCMVKGEY
jgi:NAD(P)-dependent dehydrogenase (short-subunit alcohol dehydrogenase family)